MGCTQDAVYTNSNRGHIARKRTDSVNTNIVSRKRTGWHGTEIPVHIWTLDFTIVSTYKYILHNNISILLVYIVMLQVNEMRHCPFYLLLHRICLTSKNMCLITAHQKIDNYYL